MKIASHQKYLDWNDTKIAVFQPFQKSFVCHPQWLELFGEQLHRQGISISLSDLEQSLKQGVALGLLEIKPSKTAKETQIILLNPAFHYLVQSSKVPTTQKQLKQAYLSSAINSR